MSVTAGRELVMDDAWSRPGGEDVACAAAPPTNFARTQALLAEGQGKSFAPEGAPTGAEGPAQRSSWVAWWRRWSSMKLAMK